MTHSFGADFERHTLTPASEKEGVEGAAPTVGGYGGVTGPGGATAASGGTGALLWASEECGRTARASSW